jgi:hypothetical protein
MSSSESKGHVEVRGKGGDGEKGKGVLRRPAGSGGVSSLESVLVTEAGQSRHDVAFDAAGRQRADGPLGPPRNGTSRRHLSQLDRPHRGDPGLRMQRPNGLNRLRSLLEEAPLRAVQRRSSASCFQDVSQRCARARDRFACGTSPVESTSNCCAGQQIQPHPELASLP